MHIIYEYFDDKTCRIKMKVERECKSIEFERSLSLSIDEVKVTSAQIQSINDFLLNHVNAQKSYLKNGEWVYLRPNGMKEYRYIHYNVLNDGKLVLIDKMI